MQVNLSNISNFRLQKNLMQVMKQFLKFLGLRLHPLWRSYGNKPMVTKPIRIHGVLRMLNSLLYMWLSRLCCKIIVLKKMMNKNMQHQFFNISNNYWSLCAWSHCLRVVLPVTIQMRSLWLPTDRNTYIFIISR